MSAIDLSSFLRERTTSLGLSAMDVVKKTGISRQTWYRLVNGNVKKLRLDTLECVADVLQVNAVELSYLYAKKQNLQQKSLISTVHISDYYPFITLINTSADALVNKEEAFEKKWRIINKGQSHWVNRYFVCVDEAIGLSLKTTNTYDLQPVKPKDGLTPERYKIFLPIVAPNEALMVTMPFYAPKESGTMLSFWSMFNAQGEACFPEDIGLFCQVSVMENKIDFSKKNNSLP